MSITIAAEPFVATEDLPADGSSGSAYWLCHSEGFRVDSESGRIGIVEHLRWDGSRTVPRALCVRAGLFGRRLLLIPVSEIKAVLPRQKRIVVPRSPRLLGTEPNAHVDSVTR
jgi:hypothetical protein